jgi:Fic family protein
VDWQNEMATAGVHALIRAPLLHLYFELIHPFWDGNGRVGRVLEATTLLSAGYRYAPFALARYYLAELQTYFALFNQCRRLADRKSPAPNNAFVEFHLNGMLHTIKVLHSRVNDIVKILIFETQLRRLADTKVINAREYAIVSQVLNHGQPLPLDVLRQAPWYVALYAKKAGKTRQRDLARLRDRGLLKIDEKSRLWPGFADFESGRVTGS